MDIQLNLNPVKITKYLTVCVCFLLIANAAVKFSVIYLDHNDVFGLVEMFDVDAEKNIPTFYSSLILMFSSALLLIIAFGKKGINAGYWLHWTVLAAIFMFMSIDEFAAIHELFDRPVSLVLNVSGHINMEGKSTYQHVWVIPYGIFVIAFFLTYLRFLLDLPGRTKLLFFIAGLIYVSGAIGCEMIWEMWYDPGDDPITIGDGIITTVEEMLEMTGIIVFIYTLLSYIKSEYKKLTITISL